MAEFRGIQMSLYLILLLEFTAVVTRQHNFISVRDGEDVTLPCNIVRNDQDECGGTTWSLSGSTEELFVHGKIREKAKVKSERLSLAANCSLVIKKVTAEDAGQYICQQTSSEIQQQVYLSVVTLTEREHDDKVTLSCSVTTRPVCRHTVKWLFREKGPKDMTTSESNCSATVTFLTSLTEKSKFVEFKCEVFDIYSRNVQMFTFNHQSSSEKQGEGAKEATTTSTATKPATTSTATKPATMSTATKPATMSTATKPATMSTGTKPAMKSTATKPAKESTAIQPATTSTATKPATKSTATKPAMKSTAAKPATTSKPRTRGGMNLNTFT
ncbi:mucin-13-like [Anabas testudineus]|uniref:mucin-13-like n=1 Tax=Anabas testudineus TaxID=64144 RepID=UPI00143CFE28|nr:mucin-13-like [Anabas testudineus]